LQQKEEAASFDPRGLDETKMLSLCACSPHQTDRAVLVHSFAWGRSNTTKKRRWFAARKRTSGHHLRELAKLFQNGVHEWHIWKHLAGTRRATTPRHPEGRSRQVPGKEMFSKRETQRQQSQKSFLLSMLNWQLKTRVHVSRPLTKHVAVRTIISGHTAEVDMEGLLAFLY
jgi:hypothetical protein